MIDEGLEKTINKHIVECSKMTDEELKQIDKEINQDIVECTKVACKDFMNAYEYILDGILSYLELCDTEVSVEMLHSFFFGVNSELNVKLFYSLFIEELLKVNKIEKIGNQIRIK